MSKVLIGIVIVVVVLIGGFFLFQPQGGVRTKDTGSDEIKNSANSNSEVDWRDVEIKDINTGNTLRVSDFQGQTVLLESFAVWCPTCTKQQQEIKKFHDTLEGKDIISISLDTDPNEDESRVLKHTQDNGFNWIYAVSPREMTESLIDEFGNGIVNAPLAPVVLICENGDFRKLPGGVKNSDELKEELVKGC